MAGTRHTIGCDSNGCGVWAQTVRPPTRSLVLPLDVMGSESRGSTSSIDARRGDWVRRMRFWGESTRGAT